MTDETAVMSHLRRIAIAIVFLTASYTHVKIVTGFWKTDHIVTVTIWSVFHA